MKVLLTRLVSTIHYLQLSGVAAMLAIKVPIVKRITIPVDWITGILIFVACVMLGLSFAIGHWIKNAHFVLALEIVFASLGSIVGIYGAGLTLDTVKAARGSVTKKREKGAYLSGVSVALLACALFMDLRLKMVIPSMCSAALLLRVLVARA
jgi:hypothetical protein